MGALAIGGTQSSPRMRGRRAVDIVRVRDPHIAICTLHAQNR
jgi:hypothetical protein